ncbi:MAG: coiled-coil domain-containing protein, partial [Planctomycetota bacterium]
PDDESELDVLEESTPDELISDFLEEETIEEADVRIMPFEESQQNNGPTDSPSSDINELPVVQEDSAPSEEPDSGIEQIRRDNRQLNDRVSALLEENIRLKADLQDYLQASNEVQRFRSELSEAEVALSREHSKTRLLETKINEIESLRALLEQDCRSFSERIEQLQQEKDQSKEMLERIQEELSDNREKTGRQIVDLNQQIERIAEDSDALKNEYERLRRDYETHQSQSGGEIASLTEQRDKLQQEADSLRQTVDSLNQEIAALKENIRELSAVNEQLEGIRAELEEAKSNLSQEQEQRSALEQEVGELRETCNENDHVKEHLRSEIGGYESQIQHLGTELSALREQGIQERDELTAEFQREKQQFKDALEQLQQEHAKSQETADSEIGKLNQRIERMSEKAELAKRAYDEMRHEYEAYQSQSSGELAILTERRDELQQETDSLKQKVDSLSQEVAALRENAGALSETNERFETVRAELEEAKSRLSQEQEERSALERKVKELHTVCEENSNDKERLQKEYSDYREQIGRETVELKTDHERVRQENETRQLQADNEIANLRQKLEETSVAYRELRELHAQIDSESASKEHLQLEVNQLKSDKDELIHQLSELRGQFEQTEASNQVEMEDLREKEKVEFKNQLEALNKRAEQSEQALRQLNEVKALLQEKQDEAQRLQKENAALQLQLSQLESQQQESAESIAVSPSHDVVRVEPQAIPIEAETSPQIPRYNLAEQILSDHRRSTASRRKRIEPVASKTKEASVKDVVKQYIAEPVTTGEMEPERTDLGHNLWDDDSLTLFQQELLQEIIQRDISEYCKN